MDFYNDDEFNMDFYGGDEARTRSILRILLKTLFIHAIATANYAHLISLLGVPTKHNIRLIQLLLFVFFPFTVGTHVILDFADAIVKYLRDPDQYSMATLSFYIHATLGVRAAPAGGIQDHNRSTPAGESARLLDVVDSRNASPYHSKTSAGRRLARVLATVVPMVLAIGTVVMWAERSNHNCLRSIDTRNFYTAIGSLTVSVITLLLLTFGKLHWEYESGSTASIAKWPELKRPLFAMILAGVLQELPSYTAGPWDKLPTYPTSILFIVPKDGFAWALLGVVVLAFIVFRSDLEKKAQMKFQPLLYLLFAVVTAWIMLDAFTLLVENLVDLFPRYGSLSECLPENAFLEWLNLVA